MNIHLPAILGFTRYQGFDTLPFNEMQNHARKCKHVPKRNIASSPLKGQFCLSALFPNNFIQNAWKWMKLNDVPLDQSVLFSLDPCKRSKQWVSWGVRNHITLDVSQPNVYCKCFLGTVLVPSCGWYHSSLPVESDDFNVADITTFTTIFLDRRSGICPKEWHHWSNNHKFFFDFNSFEGLNHKMSVSGPVEMLRDLKQCFALHPHSW